MHGKGSFLIVAALALLTTVAATADYRRESAPVIQPTIPQADRSEAGRVFLERADFLKQLPSDTFMILTGDVVFTKGGMIMKCDSAHYTASTESMTAFGNVSMEQGDTLFVYADQLDYDGPDQSATLYADAGKKVELINRDVKLETDVFIYDLAADVGYYKVGGVLTDPSNTLSSLEGEYVPSTKEANFYRDVHLYSRNSTDTLNIYTDTLYYNTGTHIAELLSPATVVNARGTIYTSLGVYDTDSDRTTLYRRSTVKTAQGQTLTADTIHYDRRGAFGEAWGQMVMTDSAKCIELNADYGYYDELADSTFATGRLLIKEYSSEDTLYLHGRYIETFRQIDSTHVAADTIAGTGAYTRCDTSHVAVVHPRVRFYRNDLQGICDSMRFTERDSTLRMYINPVVWNDEQQIFGNIIEVLFNDSTIRRVTLPDQAFNARHIEGEHYDQLSGKKMDVYFTDGEPQRLEMDGNVEMIIYPEESDSTINKIVNAESSFMTVWFRNRTAERYKSWPQTTGTATPLFLARRSIYFLPKFKWYGELRPLSPADACIIPEAMETLMQSLGRTVTLKSINRRSDGSMTVPPHVNDPPTQAKSSDTAQPI